MFSVVKTCLQARHDLVDRTAATFLLPTSDGSLAANDEFGLRATPSRSPHNGLLDELRQRLALAQDGFDFGPNLRLDADRRKGGGAHARNV